MSKPKQGGKPNCGDNSCRYKEKNLGGVGCTCDDCPVCGRAIWPGRAVGHYSNCTIKDWVPAHHRPPILRENLPNVNWSALDDFVKSHGKKINSSKPVIGEALTILQTILTEVMSLQISGTPFPSLNTIVDSKDGTISFEYVLPDRRVGFVCDPIPGDSSWFLVRQSGFESSSGALEGADIPKLLRDFIREN